MFTHGRTNARTPDRPVYYKLTLGELKSGAILDTPCLPVILSFRHNLVFVQYLQNDRLNETKFCIHIIIDKIYVGIVKHYFSQICNRVTALN